MGADLYIVKEKSNDYHIWEVSEKAVDCGYFRDAYNAYGLFAVISATMTKELPDGCLSWWQTRERKELFNKQGIMTFTRVLKWYKELKPIIERFKTFKRLKYRDVKCVRYKIVRDANGNMIYINHYIKNEERHYFIEHADLLLKFLEKAIAMKSGIKWSV